LQQAKAAASAEMANKLTHRINNPLQSLMQVAYLAAEGQSDHNAKTLGQEFSVDLRRSSALVTESLTLRWHVTARTNARQAIYAPHISGALNCDIQNRRLAGGTGCDEMGTALVRRSRKYLTCISVSGSLIIFSDFR